MIGSALAVFVLTIVFGIQSRKNNYKGTRYTCKDPDTNYVMLHKKYNGYGCAGDVLLTYQTPFNQCYNIGLILKEQGNDNNGNDGDNSNGYRDIYDEILEYDCYDGRPKQMYQTYYATTDGTCGNQYEGEYSKESIGYGISCTSSGYADGTSDSVSSKVVKMN